MPPVLPERAPFALRARILTPFAAGGTRFEPDRVRVGGSDGRSASIASAAANADAVPARSGSTPVVDIRPWLLMPGLVDLHIHLPQVPNAGLGFGTPLLDWLR